MPRSLWASVKGGLGTGACVHTVADEGAADQHAHSHRIARERERVVHVAPPTGIEGSPSGRVALLQVDGAVLAQLSFHASIAALETRATN